MVYWRMLIQLFTENEMQKITERSKSACPCYVANFHVFDPNLLGIFLHSLNNDHLPLHECEVCKKVSTERVIKLHRAFKCDDERAEETFRIRP